MPNFEIICGQKCCLIKNYYDKPYFQKELKEGSSLNLLFFISKKLWLEAGFEGNFGRLKV